jgi:signal transduction histidine kinase
MKKEDRMKRLILVLALFHLSLYLFLPVEGVAQEKATREECVAKCKEAAKLIEEAGLEAGLAKMNDKTGPFVWKDSYVAAVDMESGKLVAQPLAPGYIGYEIKYITDANGKLYIQEMMELAESKGEGWVSYLYPRPGADKTPVPKSSFVLKVPGVQVFVLAGYYEQKPAN